MSTNIKGMKFPLETVFNEEMVQTAIHNAIQGHKQAMALINE